MRIFSFAREGLELKPIEVEVSLLPGLPHFEVTGLADSGIKESLSRLKSALRNSNYEIPVRQRVVFNLKPAYHRKKSEGLDLAFAIGFLLASKQLKLGEMEGENIFVYGELSLDGRITVSSEISLLDRIPDGGALLTGEGGHLNVPHYRANSLCELEALEFCEATTDEMRLDRPPIQDINFDADSAHALEVVATGEHSCLLGGPAGTGKSTWAMQLHSILRNLRIDEQKEVRRIAQITGREVEWRPFVSPHHSIPSLSLIGGGHPAFPGEITRAHKGILFLDEFLEYSPMAKECLREPIEIGEITVSRRGTVQKFPAEFLLVAATNLCICGEWTPERTNRNCTRPLHGCKGYIMKLSGPLLDRFDTLVLTSGWKHEKTRSLHEIYERVQGAQRFALESRGQEKMNARLTVEEVVATVDPVVRELFKTESTSMRREKAQLRVARTIADLAGSTRIKSIHLREAALITGKNFSSIKEALL